MIRRMRRYQRKAALLSAALLLAAQAAAGAASCVYADEFSVVPDDGISEDSGSVTPDGGQSGQSESAQDLLGISGLIESTDNGSKKEADAVSGVSESFRKKAKNAKKLIAKFKTTGCIASISFEAGEKPSPQTLSQQFPKQLDVYFQEEKKPTTLNVTWTSYSDDYSSTNLNYYFFTPVFDKEKYEVQVLDLQSQMPYIEVRQNAISYEMIESAPPKENEAAVFKYCTEKLKLNTAAACGILANMYCESGFRTNALGDNGTSVGLCQWHNGRWTNLKVFAPDDWQTLEGQLRFMKKELRTGYRDTLDYLKQVSDDAQGAYDAAYYWCMHFEMPDKTVSRSITRGYLAKNVYWERYGEPEDKDDDSEEDRYRCTSEDGLRIRSDRSLDAEVIGMLEYGDEIEVTGIDGRWAEISVDGENGYCALEFLELMEPREEEQNEAEASEEERAGAGDSEGEKPLSGKAEETEDPAEETAGKDERKG